MTPAPVPGAWLTCTFLGGGLARPLPGTLPSLVACGWRSWLTLSVTLILLLPDMRTSRAVSGTLSYSVSNRASLSSIWSLKLTAGAGAG